MQITDEMCRRAVKAMNAGRIQGFSTPLNSARSQWGAPHTVRDERVIWRGDSQDEMVERVEIEKMRLAIAAALST